MIEPTPISDTKPDSEPATPEDLPWAHFNAEIREKVIGGLRAVYKELARITEYDRKEKRMKGRWAQGFSTMNSLGVLTALARALEDGMPAEASREYPGYLTKRRADVKNAVRKRR